MKRLYPWVFALGMAVPVFGQTSDSTSVTTKTATVASDFDLLMELWSVQDAVPVRPGQIDLRLTTGWVTSNAPANRGDSDDDWTVTPSIVWGAADNVEVFVNVPMSVGDGGDIPGVRGINNNGTPDDGLDGNFDTYVGMLWRFSEQVDYQPAMAFQASARIPTGDDSSGVDGEFRLIMTNDYDDGLRSHLNGFVTTSNGNNIRNNRHFQYGAVVGLDGPLCDGGAVRWVLDYMNRSSTEYGHNSINLVDAGCQWKVDDASNLGMSFQIGLDHGDDEAPNFGARLTFAHSLTY